MAAISAAPWVPMHQADVSRIVTLLKDLPKGSTIYEPGCGDARLSAALAHAGYNVIGLEISLLPFFLAHVRRWRSKDKFSIRYKNFWSQNFSDADAVVMFLMPAANRKLQIKFNAELKPGAYVVSYAFFMPDWQPVVVDQKLNAPKVCVYVKK